jgi:hypothetical protein
LSLLYALDIQYIDTIVNTKIGRFPAAYTKPDARRSFRRTIKECIIQLFTLPKDLPYRIGECRIYNEFCIGLFVTNDTTTTEVAKALRAHEPQNSEILWNRKTSEDHDSCVMNKWIETGKELERGRYWKDGFRDIERVVEGGSRAYKAHCLISARLMFANHVDNGHFMFLPYQPVTTYTIIRQPSHSWKGHHRPARTRHRPSAQKRRSSFDVLRPRHGFRRESGIQLFAQETGRTRYPSND